MAFKINASYLQDTTLAAQGTKPEREAQALSLARQLDIPQPAVEQNLDQAQQSAQLQGNLKTLDGSPELSAFVANNLGCCRFRGHRPKLFELSRTLSD